MLLLADPGLPLLLQGVHIKALEGLEEVQRPVEKRHAVTVGLLSQDMKPRTTGVLLDSWLLPEKLLQLMIGVGELLGFFRTGGEAGALAGERQLFHLMAFVLGPQGPELLDVLRG